MIKESGRIVVTYDLVRLIYLHPYFQLMLGSQNQYNNSSSFKVVRIFKENEITTKNLDGSFSSTCPSQIPKELIFMTPKNIDST